MFFNGVLCIFGWNKAAFWYEFPIEEKSMLAIARRNFISRNLLKDRTYQPTRANQKAAAETTITTIIEIVGLSLGWFLTGIGWPIGSCIILSY